MIALSNDAGKLILEKWGIKHCTGMEINIMMAPNEIIKVGITKVLSQTEFQDCVDILGDYYLVKKSDPK